MTAHAPKPSPDPLPAALPAPLSTRPSAMPASGPAATPRPARHGPVAGPIVARYDYRDERGRLLFEVVRHDPKAFRARRPDGHGGWIGNLQGVRRVLYRLPRVVAAPRVLVLEGEKDVETAERLGLPPDLAVTCSPFGACQWRSDYSAMLADKIVYLCADNDQAGQEHLQQVGLALLDHGLAVRQVELPRPAKDLTDWVGAGGDAVTLIRLLEHARHFTLTEDAAALVRTLRPLADAAGGSAAVYEYTDADGLPRLQVLRSQPKAFRTRCPDGRGGWRDGVAGVKPVLYRLREVRAADAVLILEGEKDVETALQLGLPGGWAATCNPFGACQWRAEYGDALVGKAVTICPDNDPPGQDHLRQVAVALHGVAREVRVLALPAAVKDLSDWVLAGADAAAFRARLSAATPCSYPLDPLGTMTRIAPLDGALATVARLHGVLLAAPAGAPWAPGPAFGFEPARVAPVLPGWVTTGPDGAPAVCVRGFEALATAAITELAADTAGLGAAAAELIARLDRLGAAAPSPPADRRGEGRGPRWWRRLTALVGGRRDRHGRETSAAATGPRADPVPATIETTSAGKAPT